MSKVTHKKFQANIVKTVASKNIMHNYACANREIGPNAVVSVSKKCEPV